MPKISNEVLAVLGNCSFEGNALILPPGQLERPLYEAVNKVLAANGGKWNRNAKAHIFDEPAEEAIEQALITGEFHRVKQDLGQFDTPAGVAGTVIGMADVADGQSILEPSAGIGGIAKFLRRLGYWPMCFEIDPKRAAVLESQGLKVKCADFLTIEPPPSSASFDRVIMNPPFAKQADIDHVLHAIRFVRPGGRLVSIMSASVLYRSNEKTRAFRDDMEMRGAWWEELPKGAFAESGTQVSACILAVDL